MAGIQSRASSIDLTSSPGSARTGKPLGSPVDTLQFELESKSHTIEASLADAMNPFVFVLSDHPAHILQCEESGIDFSDRLTEVAVEAIRRSGARAMELDPGAQAQPKIAVLSLPAASSEGSIVAHAYSMDVLHKAIPMTVRLYLGVAARIKGTMAWKLASESQNPSAEL